MFRKLTALATTALLMSACSQPEQAAAPPAPPPPAAGKAYMVFFDFNSTVLSPQARDTLKQAAAAAKAAGSGVTATGHADRAGSDAYNMALSHRRADTVRATLRGLQHRNGRNVFTLHGEADSMGATIALTAHRADGTTIPYWEIEAEARTAGLVLHRLHGHVDQNAMAVQTELHRLGLRRLVGFQRPDHGGAQFQAQLAVNHPH